MWRDGLGGVETTTASEINNRVECCFYSRLSHFRERFVLRREQRLLERLFINVTIDWCISLPSGDFSIYQYIKLKKCIILAEQNKHLTLLILTAGNKNIQYKIYKDLLFDCLDMGCIHK